MMDDVPEMEASDFFDEDDVVDCPICLDPMTQEDHFHVLQCKHHCGYNFCHECIESLIASSKDDYMEASDGNKHVKVFLHCPNCRSDLSSTIRDTLLLRKADACVRITHREKKSKDALTESQQALLKAMHTQQVKDAIAEARKAEAEYLAQEGRSPAPVLFRPSLRGSFTSQGSAASGTEWSDHEEEWGVEVDLEQDVHSSFRMPKQPKPRSLSRAISSVAADPSLFAGLESCMTDGQCLAISAQMISGKPDELAKAAFQLYQILHDEDPMDSSAGYAVGQAKPMLKHRSSIFQLIKESQAAHAREEKKEDPFMTPRAELMAQSRQRERSNLLKASIQKKFPLPVRMPKSIVLDNLSVDEEFDDLSFIDHTWDGTVLDAYSKITIGLLNAIWQKETENRGVRRVLGEGTGHLQIELPGQPRVLMLHAGRAGRQGAHRGDVVTHIDGASVMDLDAHQVLKLIKASATSGAQRVTLTLNAERSVAEALKRRAQAIKEDV